MLDFRIDASGPSRIIATTQYKIPAAVLASSCQLNVEAKILCRQGHNPLKVPMFHFKKLLRVVRNDPEEFPRCMPGHPEYTRSHECFLASVLAR